MQYGLISLDSVQLATDLGQAFIAQSTDDGNPCTFASLLAGGFLSAVDRPCCAGFPVPSAHHIQGSPAFTVWCASDKVVNLLPGLQACQLN